MDGVLLESEHPKKRRRRHYKDWPWSARLVLDDSLRGNVGIVSEDLWSALDSHEYDDYGMVRMVQQRVRLKRHCVQERACSGLMVSNKIPCSSPYAYGPLLPR